MYLHRVLETCSSFLIPTVTADMHHFGCVQDIELLFAVWGSQTPFLDAIQGWKRNLKNWVQGNIFPRFHGCMALFSLVGGNLKCWVTNCNFSGSGLKIQVKIYLIPDFQPPSSKIKGSGAKWNKSFLPLLKVGFWQGLGKMFLQAQYLRYLSHT